MSEELANRDVLIGVRRLSKHFPLNRSLPFVRSRYIRAVQNVGFDIYAGETLALVGESGSGKSTIGRLILRLLEPTEAELTFRGRDILSLNGEELRSLRQHMQMVFQDPASALDPRMKIQSILEEPFRCHKYHDGGLSSSVDHLLDVVGLSKDYRHCYPHELSGGQKQRISIARAIALHPAFIVCDEPVSALDASHQAQVVNLLRDLQVELSLTYLFISHDLRIVRQAANRVAVLYLGRVVELADSEQFYSGPLHPYSQALIDASPSLESSRRNGFKPLSGDPPDPTNPPTGCSFRNRCPFAEEVCSRDRPELERQSEGHLVACHLYGRRHRSL